MGHLRFLRNPHRNRHLQRSPDPRPRPDRPAQLVPNPPRLLARSLCTCRLLGRRRNRPCRLRQRAHARHQPARSRSLGLLRASLDAAAAETDREPADTAAAPKRALILRHIVEQACTEILFRFGRALGPRPLAFDRDMSDRCQQLTLYIRQSHAESDLEELGRLSLGPPGL